jgi:heterodisulfide reductase subunit B
VSRRAHRISSYAVDKKSDGIVLSCPLCRFNLDQRGKDAEKKVQGYTQLPIFYYTQLIAIALGLDPGVCGFDDHVVNPLGVLKKKKVISGGKTKKSDKGGQKNKRTKR